ncbi:MAG TPA: hypothetical protein VKR06_05020 [Ktedonosporobacter sp.]|nr:hypothetical protein [Ktedonosporobacter sp.]
MASYLERYLQGECIEVWAELVALDDQVRKEPIFSDAWAVARETMRRVRQNIEVLIPRLRALGYVFVHDQFPRERGFSTQELDWIRGNPPVRTEPASDIVLKLDALEREVGLLPLSLRAFYQEVGGVNFVGWYEDQDVFDPLFVYAFDRGLVEGPDEDLPVYSDDWADEYTEEEPPIREEYYQVVIAPNSYHKMNVSGGSAYAIRIPNATADAVVLNEKHQTTLVNYLRLCCLYAGFPALEMMPYSLTTHLDELRRDMLPF